jgi:hypothetical protein
MRGNGISRGTGIAGVAAIFGAVCILGLSFITEALARDDGPICQPNTKEGRASYRAQRHYLSINYPERLVRQIDLLPRCIYCMQTSRGFVIEAVYQGSDEVKSQQWSAIEEVRHLDLLARGKIAKFRIRYQGDDDCSCCGGPKTSTAAWIDEKSRYAPPSDITEIPPLPPARQFARKKSPRPPRPASAKCKECGQAAESRNTIARRLFETTMQSLEAEYQEGLAEHEAKRWSERLQVLATIPSVKVNEVALSEARALAEKEFIAANNRSNQAKNAAGDAKNQIAALTSSLAEADRALAACEASKCNQHVAAETEPVKLYSVGGNLKPAKLYSVGTLSPKPVIEAKISIGLGGSSGTSSYDSTGGQAPFSGDWSHSTGQICGGATFYPGLVIGPASVGFDVNVCSGSNTFGSGDTTLFAIMRHGPGDVALRSSTNVIIDTLFKAEFPLADPQAVYDPRTNSWFLSVGVGPAFREQNLALISDQSFFGGGVPSISGTTWQTGLAVSAGLSTFVCPTCIAGNPLKIGIEGKARFFPPKSISLTSPVFGFTETGSTGAATDYSALVTLSMPLVVGGGPNSYDVPRSVYVRKDHLF